jgi:hypothetical protein
MVPGVEAGEARRWAAGEGVDVDGVPHPRQVRHAVRGRRLGLLLLALHGDHHARSRTAREEPPPAGARRRSGWKERGSGGVAN